MKLKRKIDYKDQLLTWEQLEAVLSRKDIILSDADTIISKSKVNDISWEEAEIVYNSFSTDDRTKIRKSGQKYEEGWWIPETQSISAPKSQPTESRGIMITQMYLSQNLACAYSGLGPYHILDFQVEHIDPLLGDCPDNIVLVLSNINENKMQSAEKFIANCQRRYEMGEMEYKSWYSNMKEAVKKNKLEKARILNMSEHELCQYWLTRTNYDNDKYVWRNIGMSNLSPFRVRKDGTVRSGGTQGNYKDVLNTIAAEYLFGDPDLARDIYNCSRMFRANYLNGQIQREDYALFTSEVVELSNHVYPRYNRQKFIANLIRNNHSWEHLK